MNFEILLCWYFQTCAFKRQSLVRKLDVLVRWGWMNLVFLQFLCDPKAFIHFHKLSGHWWTLPRMIRLFKVSIWRSEHCLHDSPNQMVIDCSLNFPDSHFPYLCIKGKYIYLKWKRNVVRKG